MSKKCKVIGYLEKQNCTVCCISRKPFYEQVKESGFFTGCYNSKEKYDGEFLTLILLNNGYYCDVSTYKIIERKVFRSFAEIAETIGVEALGYEDLSTKGFTTRMCRIFEPESGDKTVVFKLEKQEYPVFNDPTISEFAKKSIAEFETDKKCREYLLQLQKILPLSQNEEHSLAIQAINGDDEAKSQIVRKYLPLVFETAKHYANINSSFYSLIRTGNTALVNALESLNKIEISKISDYFHWVIRKEILKESSKSFWLCRFPAYTVVEKISKFKATQEKLQKEYGRTPTDEELSKELSWSLESVNDYLDYGDEKSEKYLKQIYG